MNGRRFKIVIFVSIVTLSFVQARAAEKKQYKLKFEKGQRYYIKMITEQQISQSFMEQEQNIEQTIGMGTDLDVNDVDDNGNAWVRYTYRWAKLRQKGPMGEIIYDSSEEDSPVPPPAQGFAALLGEGFLLKMTPKGQVEEVKGLEKMRSNILTKLPEGPMREGMMKGLEQYLSDEAIKEMTESSMAMYPDNPVGVGDSWSKEVVLSHGFGMALENKWTLKESKDGVATVEVVSVIKPNAEAKPMEMGDTKMSYEFSGKQQGLIKIQESTGQLMHSKIEQQLSGKMKIQAPGPEAQEMTMPMKIKGIITMEMSERKK